MVATDFLVVGKALSHSDILYYIDHFKLGAELLLRSDIFLYVYHFKLGAEAVSKRKPRKEGA